MHARPGPPKDKRMLIQMRKVYTSHYIGMLSKLFSPYTKAALLAYATELSKVERFNFVSSLQEKNEYSPWVMAS
uniref:Uncharacterized protein n=1 Tax=Salix viminalis TaxID=40686 RepID=A0A6N2KQT8_SALVM